MSTQSASKDTQNFALLFKSDIKKSLSIVACIIALEVLVFVLVLKHFIII